MDDIINKIRRYYKAYNNILEIKLTNYEGLNYYIRLDTDKKNKYCYLRSYNFNLMNTFDKNCINQETLNNGLVDYIYDAMTDYNIPYEYNSVIKDREVVNMTIRYGMEVFNFNFNQFIPKEFPFLADIFFALTQNLPKRIDELFPEIIGLLNNTAPNYTYNKEIKFNLFKDNIDKLFNTEIIKKGIEYYKDHRVRFVEEVGGSYYAIVDGTNKKLYSVIINYDKKKHTIQMSCTCPCKFRCKHMYAVLLHVLNKEFFPFYKVRFIGDSNGNMYDKLFSNNNYLCIGIDSKNLLLLMPDGEIQSFKAFEDNKPLYEVVDDDKDHTLQNTLDKIKELD